MFEIARHFIFRHYFWIALAVAIVASCAIGHLLKTDRLMLVGSVVAATLGFCYFVQQQKLAETTLFKQLFSEFNARYDGMNEQLASIAKLGKQADENDKSAIVDYFNLCAEEFLFYKEGYI